VLVFRGSLPENGLDASAEDMLMSKHDSFIQAILDDPEDHALRLVYADWLEEHGDSRAEIIRLQCELALLHEDQPETKELRTRIEELLKSTRQDESVVRLYHLLLPGQAFELSYDRGLYRISITAQALRAVGAELLRAVPMVQFHLSWLQNHVETLCSAAGLDRVVSLDLSEDPQLFTDLQHFLTSRLMSCLPHLRTWRMRTGHNGLADPAAIQLAAAPILGQLSDLILCWNHVGVKGVEALVHSPHLRRLRHLDLSANSDSTGRRLGDEGIRILTESTQLRRLTHLDYSFNWCTPSGVRMLAESTALPSLKCLRLQDWESLPPFSPESREAIELLIQSSNFSKLETLWLHAGGYHDMYPEVEWLKGRTRPVALHLAGGGWY
jgi:uncharacterized protein (TIGR02996 family)